jgi:hypothetical protein
MQLSLDSSNALRTVLEHSRIASEVIRVVFGDVFLSSLS